MSLVQMPECGGFDLSWADRLRKSIAKKNPKEFEELEKEYFEQVDKLGLSKRLCVYVWKVCVSMSKGYGFNKSHTESYSLIALQEMNLAYKFPIIYWNTACLMVDSGSLDDENNISTDYAKLARSIGSTRARGIEVSLPDINKSNFGFAPDAENNRILFGLKAILNVSTELSQDIIKNRGENGYESLYEFLDKVPIKKQSMVALIKSGAFDSFYDGDRKFILMLYLWLQSDRKKKLTLQNFPKLIECNLLPKELSHETETFKINKILKKSYVKNNDFYLDQKMTNKLLETYPDLDFYSFNNGLLYFSIKDWEKFYKKVMKRAKDWIDDNQDILLEKINDIAFLEEWDKYKGKDNISAWEMEALCFYYHAHELKGIDYSKYGLVNFFNLPREPEVDKVFKKKDVDIKMYRIRKIIGTVIAKDKMRASISLLTLEGVVNVKFPKEYFAMFDKQISEILPDGTKKVREKSWFTKGNILIVQGYRREDDFVAKKYSKTPGHTLYKAEIKEDKSLLLTGERYEGELEDED